MLGKFLKNTFCVSLNCYGLHFIIAQDKPIHVIRMWYGYYFLCMSTVHLYYRLKTVFQTILDNFQLSESNLPQFWPENQNYRTKDNSVRKSPSTHTLECPWVQGSQVLLFSLFKLCVHEHLDAGRNL